MLLSCSIHFKKNFVNDFFLLILDEGFVSINQTFTQLDYLHNYFGFPLNIGNLFFVDSDTLI